MGNQQTVDKEKKLLLAAEKGDLNTIKSLWGKEKDPKWWSETSNFSGANALHLSAASGHLKVVTFLIATCKIDTNKLVNGSNALMLAAANGQLDTVKYLSDFCHIDVNIRGPGGSAVAMAAVNGKLDMVKYLAEKCNADLYIKDYSGKTALDLADSNGHTSIAKYLEAKAPRIVEAPKPVAKFVVPEDLLEIFTLAEIPSKDHVKYARLLMEQRITKPDMIAKLSESKLEETGILLGDAIQILAAAKKLSSKAINKALSAEPIIAVDSGKITIPSTIVPLLESRGIKTVFFASHNWGEQQNVHSRVRIIVSAFKEAGLPVWFDDERLTGNIDAQITRGIDETGVFVAFITKDYVEKVKNGADSARTDWCSVEFNYASNMKTDKMIAVVMEPEMLDQTKWRGPVGSRLGGSLFVDFTSNDKLESCLQLLCSLIREKL